MAKIKDKEKKLNKSKINSIANFIQNNIGSLYKSTYYNDTNNKTGLDSLKSEIDKSIDSILDKNMDTVGISNISKMYVRINQNKSGNKNDKEVMNQIESIFDDKTITDNLLMSTFNENKYLKDFDEEIDMICKYMPQLEDALDAKKDNVLSSDHFSKDFINVINNSNVKIESTFLERIKEIKEKYNLLEVIETMYDNTAKYGEQFVYIVPYSKAITKLLQNKSDVTMNNFSSVSESVINEAFTEQTSKIEFDFSSRKVICTEGTIDPIDETLIKDRQLGKVLVELNTSGILKTAVSNHKSKINNLSHKGESIFPQDKALSFEGIDGQESLIKNNTVKEKDNIKIEVPGCIIKLIPRENVIPIYIDNICFGYYYIEMDSNRYFAHNRHIDPLFSINNKRTNMLNNEEEQKDNVLMYLSNQLSKYIDSKFVNSNQDLTKEIYIILKGNEMLTNKKSNQIKVTFIPPEDMIHMYFNKDPKTNRGISDLNNSLPSAKLYTALYMASTIGYLTRGFDKRVYYVKQNIETNIAQTLLNTINQIKKANFGARELGNFKGMLNSTGRYNDYVIPFTTSGDSPITFEIMPGQQIEIKTELMNQLEQMSINATDVPYEYVQSRQTVDYAVRLTMSSGKFLRKCFKRQGLTKRFLSTIMTILYNTEYNENDTLEVNLPPPAFLNIVNTNQMLQNSNDLANYVVTDEASTENEQFKAEFNRLLKRYYLSTYIDYNVVDELKRQTKIELEKQKNMNDDQQTM